MKKFFRNRGNTSLDFAGAAEISDIIAKNDACSLMNNQYAAGCNSKTYAYLALDEDDLEEAYTHFIQACQHFTAIKASLRGQVFLIDPVSREESLVAMTGQNTDIIFRYIEVITILAEMQMKFASYQDAELNIKEFLRLADYTQDSTAGDYYHKEIIDNIKRVALFKNNEKFAFDKLAIDEKKLLIKIVAEVLSQEHLLALANSGDESLDFFVVKKWHCSLTPIDGVDKQQFEKIQRLQRRLIPESLEDWQQSTSPKMLSKSAKRVSWAKSSSPEGASRQASSPKQSTSIKKRAKSDQNALKNVGIDWVESDVSIDYDKEANYTAPSLLILEVQQATSNAQLIEATASAANTMKEEINMQDITEVVNKALRDAFEEFEGTYEKTGVKKQAYHLVTATNELRRVLYVIPPDNCKSAEDVARFANQVTTVLTSKNSDKHYAKNVESEHIVKKLPGEAWTKIFKAIKISANSAQKQNVKVVLDDKPMGTVAVVLRSAVYAYMHLYGTVNKRKAQPPLPAATSAEPKPSAAQPSNSKDKITLPKTVVAVAKPPVAKSPVVRPNSGARFKFVSRNPQAVATGPKSSPGSLSPSTRGAPVKRASSESSSSEHLTSEGRTATPILTNTASLQPQKQPGSPAKLTVPVAEEKSPDLKRPRDDKEIQSAAGLIEIAVESAAEGQAETKKLKEIAAVPTEADHIDKEVSSGSGYSNFLSLFGSDPEVQALLQQKKAEEERAKAASEAAEKARAEVEKIKPVLKSVKQESAGLLVKAKQKFMDDLKKEVEAKKREREEKEMVREEAEKRAKAKAEKLLEKRKEIEVIKQFEHADSAAFLSPK